MSHQALNDKSVEGVRHQRYPIFSVQYHPEAAPGPEDSNYLFDQFMELMEKGIIAGPADEREPIPAGC